MIIAQVGRILDERGVEPGAILFFVQRQIIHTESRCIELFFQVLIDFGQCTEFLLLTLEDFNAEQGVMPPIRQPGYLHAGIAYTVVAEQIEIGEILVGEIPVMRMLVVHVADVRKEFTHLDLKPVRQRTGLQPGLLEFHIATRFDRQQGGRIEIGIDARREANLGAAKVESLFGTTVRVVMAVVGTMCVADAISLAKQFLNLS